MDNDLKLFKIFKKKGKKKARHTFGADYESTNFSSVYASAGTSFSSSTTDGRVQGVGVLNNTLCSCNN